MAGSKEGERLPLKPAQRYKIMMQMKALTIPTSRTSMRESMRSMSATVSNLRQRLDERVCLAVAVVATVVLFAALGAMHVPTIIVSGLTALTMAAVAPTAQEGGES